MANLITIPQANVYTVDDLQELWYKYYDSFVGYIQYQLLWAPRKSVPWLQCEKGERTYTDDKIIMIGLSLVNEMFHPANEVEFLMSVLYLIGHEVGHIKHTPNKPWIYGINEGVRQICIVASEHYEGKNARRFVKDEDINKFLEFLEKNHNIKVQKTSLEQFCHSIQNSLEDGREERLEAKENANFKKRMQYGRGLFWTQQELPIDAIKEAKSGNRGMKLEIKTAQILSLATTSLYQKGFLDKFSEGDDIYDDLERDFVPRIVTAVTAGTCRKCMDEAIAIEKLLALEIMEACNNNSLENLLKQLSNMQPGLSPDEKETHNGLSKSEMQGEDGQAGDSDVFGDGVGDLNGKKNLSEEGETKSEDSQTKGNKQKSGCVYDHNSNRAGKRNEGDTANAVSNVSGVTAAVLEAMKDAAAQQSGLLGKIVTKANNKKTPISTYNPKNKVPVVPLQGVKAKYPTVTFKEHNRVYDVRLPMPSDLQLRADEFEKQIEDILQNKKKTIYGLRSGKLDSGSIYKLIMGELDLFTEEDTPHEFDGCCYILQDNSGSMGYGSCSKREYACEANAVIEQGLGNLMPLKVVAFDSSGSNYVTHEIVKEFDEIQPMNCSYNFLIQGRGGSCNMDGYDIRIATQELLSRSEKQKLLIVLSDGTPSGYSTRGGIEDVADAVNDAIKSGIKVVGIYFADNLCDSEINKYRKMYGDDIIATTPDKIEKELIELMKSFYFN